MALQNTKFLFNLLLQEIRISPEIRNFNRLYSGSNCGKKDNGKKKDQCPPMEKKCEKKDSGSPKNECPPKDKCSKKDKSSKKDPCGPKGPSPPEDPCKTKKTSESKTPCISKLPQLPSSGFQLGVICPPPSCPNPCCPAPPSYLEECCKPICSTAVDGKVAVITGGALGIGYHCAIAILKNGGKVMLGDVKVKEGKQAMFKIIDQFGYNKAAFIKCDVTNARDMECLFDAAENEFEQIDIVVNNAGIFDNRLTDKTVDINIKGVIKGTFLGFEHMRRNKNGGTIVNISSIYGFKQFFGVPVYSGSKWFVLGFSRSMGHDYFYNQTGVKVMTLCPGITVTTMVEGLEEASQLEGFGSMVNTIHKVMEELPIQSGEDCGMHIIDVLEANINGSDWISEASEVYRAKRVDRHTLRMADR